MITHVWSVLCERSILDNYSNNVVLMVLEQIGITAGLPRGHKGKFILPIKAQLVSLWARDPTFDDAGLDYRMRIKNPEGREVAKAFGSTNFGEMSRLRTTAGIEGIPFKEDGNGIFMFVVDYKHKGKWKNVANVPLEIKVDFIAPPPETPSP